MIFTIDANIGAGKTTVLDYLHRYHHVAIDLEPVERWTPFLDELYRYNKGAFEFQVRVWLDRCWVQQRPNMAPIVMERSPYFQANVFVPTNLDEGRISIREYHTLQEMYQKTLNMWAPHAYIYLRSDPLQCHGRIAKRGRESEADIPVEYLVKLHEYHERAYRMAVAQRIPVICIHVEGKTIPQICQEVLDSLMALGYPYQNVKLGEAQKK